MYPRWRAKSEDDALRSESNSHASSACGSSSVGHQASRPRLSVVCCALNEEDMIGRTVESITASSRRSPGGDAAQDDTLLPISDVIVVDGGSRDATVKIARKHGARVICAGGGRANQLNVGARAATGNILLFLHSDCRLPVGYRRELHGRACGGDGSVLPDSWGAFRDVCIDPSLPSVGSSEGNSASIPRAPSQASLAVVEFGIRLRTELLSMPYGDQGIWMTRDVFDAEKGWPNMKFMEDFAMSRKLKRSHGRPRLIRNSPRDGTGDMRLRISGRRWRKLGVLKTFLINQYIIAMYNFGIRDMDFLRNLYYKPDGK